jgi:hypothetical protein
MDKDALKEEVGSVASSALSSRIPRSNKGVKNGPPPVVINKETRNVYCAKLVMIGVLAMTAVASAMATFLYTANQVDSDFEQRVRKHLETKSRI